MGWTELVGLVTFGIVVSGSPGPNNALLLASGVRFGFKRTVPHVIGAAAGVGAIVIAVAAGVGTLLDTIPGGQLALKLLSAIEFPAPTGQHRLIRRRRTQGEAPP